MLICHCQAVTDRAIRAAVRNGAQTVSEVARHCGAAGHCGGCQDAVQDLIHSETAQHASQHALPAADTQTSISE